MTHHLLSGFRHLERHLVYAALSATGLVVGISAAIVIFLWTRRELSFNRQHPDNNRVFMILAKDHLLNGEVVSAESTPASLAEYMLSTLPEVEAVSRAGYSETLLIGTHDREVYAEGRGADSSYFKVFHHTFIEGDVNRLLRDNNSIVISDKLRSLLFGNEKALGKEVALDNLLRLRVTGVFKDDSENSSIDDQFVMPISYHLTLESADGWEPYVYTYAKLKDASQKENVEQQIKDYDKGLQIEQIKTELYMFALTDWYLHWNDVVRGQGTSRVVYVIAFSLAGGLILLMSCINFVNLATARATTRAKEIGVRKMSGATRIALVRQFIAESTVITAASAVISIAFVYLALPLFNFITESRLTFDLLDPIVAGGLVTITIVASILAGGYPALLLSALKPVTTLKGSYSSALIGGAGLRKVLVVVQFTLSVVMVFSAIVVYQQISFLRNKNLGYDRHNVISIHPDSDFPIEAFKTTAATFDGLVALGEGATSPDGINGTALVEWKLNGVGEQANFNNAAVDYGYLPTLGLEFVAGRNFSQEFASDSTGVVITEEAADILGFDDPIGQTLKFGSDCHIIGVVRNFHNANIHEPAMPVLFFLGNDNTFGRWREIFFRYAPERRDDVIAQLEKEFRKLYPNRPFEYTFLDQNFERNFWADRLTGKLSIAFMVVAVFLACIGLFGLTLFNTQRRVKEIGIRKALGATVSDVVIMLCRDFSRPIVFAIVIALPLSWYLMTLFLDGYLFHTTLGFLPVASTIGLIVIFGLLTVSFQSLDAARKNPAESLKTE